MRAVLALGVTAFTLIAANDPAPHVTVDTGKIAGKASGDVEAFLGIPYAAPPVGPLRWRSTQPAARWSGVRPADALGPDCMQARDRADDHRPLSEDCLTVNVWRPAQRTARARPVLVWIHGGGFVAGGSQDPQTWGDALARRGIVVVTFNYRLGRLGFFAHPGLSAEHAEDPMGNYGYLDQIAALKWVQRNIARFGGDPRAVTVMGESAGGESVLALAGSAMAEGLFARAIVQSGGGREPLLGRRLLRGDLPERVSAEKAGLAFAKAQNIGGEGPEALAALRALPAEQVNARLTMASLIFGELERFAGPIEDGRIVTARPAAALATAKGAIPMLVGTTGADLGFNLAASKDAAFAQFGDGAAAARAAYDPDGKVALPLVNTRIGADRIMQEPARLVAQTLAARGAPAWRFRFSYVATGLAGKPTPGAEHASDVAYAFDTLDVPLAGKLTPGDRAVARMLGGYWLNFVRNGDPNGPGLANWPRVDKAGEPMLEFEADGKAVAKADPWKVRLDLAQANAASKP
ncbi:para-nitrobenzyl esterase [Sphingomonas naasensis]|uniref:Carboxylic ester hydrolase n=1 Tax=Sphingomonas naasensis TaxID=1344951 RepID=A0A4S1WS99_9SPHN|nr:carboxylesterase family protein [Sphingomonas naasensis]NIJ19077.1 para-nitrobenzyl esterase [Sphingomonas naasensis]TGX46274.1 carboxylesterase family protein [Sphingomonas naasensis]